MKDTYLNARLIQPDLIRLVIFSDLPWEKIEPTLVTDGVTGPAMKPTRINTLASLAIADFRLSAPLPLGHSYFFQMPQYGSIPLEVSEATSFPGFDENYHYTGDDLGATYSEKGTSFAVWAPLASAAAVFIRDKESDPYSVYTMTRGEKGVYRVYIPGDHKNAQYHYSVTNSEMRTRVTDPYAKGSTQNGRESVVVDFDSLKVDFKRECLPVAEEDTDAIIYEGHVRDLTIHPHTDIVHKGTFKGLAETGRKTKGGHPAGIDYIASLGVTHVQLLPIYDYGSVDEKNPMSGYNWGYDPVQYFVPEGSYASKLDDPLSRIKDCKEMVAAFHKKGIRVVMDVVYNHVYEYQASVFEKVVPNYYFRHKGNGKIANTSGCGDDLASERPMVRKMIVDACKFWIDEYGIDGFRFDLMGIIDCETLNQIADYALSKDPSFILYGEGWNMGGEVRVPLGHMDNNRLLPRFAFFNDFFRETIKNLFCGDRGANDNAKNVLTGSCMDFYVGAKFLSACQSINYIECHDNGTYFDIVSARRGDLDEEQRLKTVLGATGAVLFGLGIPFLHAGQEIGLTKFGHENTYNEGDRFNQFDYDKLDERFAFAESVAKAISLRKKLRALHIFDPRVIRPAIHVEDKDDAILITFIDPNLIAPRKGLSVIINASEHDSGISFTIPLSILYGDCRILEEGESTNRVIVPPRSVAIVETK